MLDQPNQVYVDGINSINFLNGMIRIGIGSLIPAAEEGQDPSFSEDYRLIIPLNSFLAGFQSQKDLIDQLEAKGVITKTEQNKTADQSIIVPDEIK